MSPRRICVVTGTRAEYGILYWVLKEIAATPALELSLVATGSHLSPEFGLTYRDIERDGFRIDAKVEMLLSSDSPVGVAKSLALAVQGCAEAFERLRPDLVLLVGDRYEILGAAQAALLARIPVAHIAGGDITEGAYDDSIRHAVTKLSHLHLVTNAESARRVRQLGEDPAHIHVVGSPALDHLHRTALMDRGELQQSLGFQFRARNLLVTFHPATLDPGSPADQLGELLRGIELVGGDVGVLLTRPGADVASRTLGPVIDDFVGRHPHARAFASLGHVLYLSAMAQVDVVVGNSSSGLYEAPSLHKPTVNVGDRQRGRVRASSVIDCPPVAGAVAAAIREAFAHDCSQVRNPYGDGHAAANIVAIVRDFPDLPALVRKRFRDSP
jgi:UDP-hydrolysing UDP-N-acetyl-D-glucosamine 2-epimerase